MAQWFGALTALAEDSSVFPIGGSLQSPVAPAPGDLTTSGLRVHRHSCTYETALTTPSELFKIKTKAEGTKLEGDMLDGSREI